jgi:DNA-binding LacI/PurR family transcriptional regulator
MTLLSTKDGPLARLAERIESDIRQRGLGPGDRYLTAAEVARLLGVSTMTANRAMQELADRRVLARGRRTGSFVGDGFEAKRSPVRCVYLLVYPDFFAVAKEHLDQVIVGLHGALPSWSIQFTFLPAQDEVAFARGLVESANETSSFGGAVLFAASSSLQRYFVESKVPAVAAGSIYPEAGGLPWIDRDQERIGRLLAGHLLQGGSRRIAVLMRDRWGYGDNFLVDGVHAALEEAGRSYGSLVIRSLPPETDRIAAMIRDLLASEVPPTGLLCRTRLAADVAADVVRQQGKAARKVAIVFADYPGGPEGTVPYPCVRGLLTSREQGAVIGQMLEQLGRGERPVPDHYRIDVELLLPK